jgi:hypothetical protein
MVNHRFATLGPLVLLAIGLPALAPGAPAASRDVTDCGVRMFRGFDSRLGLSVAAAVPSDIGEVLAFEIANDTPLLAAPRRLVGLAPERIVVLPSLDVIRGAATDADGRIVVSTTSGPRIVAAGGLERSAFFRDAAAARSVWVGSGAPGFLRIDSAGERHEFHLVRADGAQVRIGVAVGRLGPVSWNAIGLAAVVDDGLFTWENGALRFTQVAVDAGLRAARGLALVGPGRAVVCTQTATFLLTENSRVIVAAVGGIPRWHGQSLFVLDSGSSVVWKIEGLTKLGEARDDAAHARALLSGAGVPDGNDAARFAEAARLIGCRAAREGVGRR